MGCLKLEILEKYDNLKITFRAKNSVFLGDLDYYPFGMEMPGRTYNSPEYKFGFNGKLKDDEWTGVTGATYDYGFRIFDSRLGRFLSVDPLTKDYPWYTPYQFAGNTPIQAIDKDGLEEHHYTLTYNTSKKPAITNIKYHHTNYYTTGGILESDKKLIPAGETWYILHYRGETWKYDTKEEMMKSPAAGLSREQWRIKLQAIAIDIAHGGSSRGFEQTVSSEKQELPENKTGATEPPNNVPGQPYKMYPNGIMPNSDKTSETSEQKKQEDIEQKTEKPQGKVDY